jgi:choline-sulfatase
MKRAPAIVAWTLALCGVWGCAPANPTRLPNVILIVIDTLRADHVGSYGYSRDTTPNLDALSLDSTLFERALSSAPWTMPAVGAIMTGVYPNRLGVRNSPVALPRAWDSLATHLKNAGYSTGGLVAHTWVGEKLNFDRGFDHWDQENAKGHDGVSSPDLTQKAQRFFNENQQVPFFLFLHYFDSHYEYIEPEEQTYSQEYWGKLRSYKGLYLYLQRRA